MTIRATVLISEGIRIEYDGKLTAVGIFTTKIAVNEPAIGPILSFVVIVEGEESDPMTGFSVDVNLPGIAIPTVFDVPDNLIPQVWENRKWRKIVPLQMMNVNLNPGEIRCGIRHPGGRIDVAAGLIAANRAATASIGEPQPA